MNELVDLLSPATVKLLNKKTGQLIGTGFFISEDLFLTALHNLPDAIGELTIEYPCSGDTLKPWTVIRKSPLNDFAIIRINEWDGFEACFIGLDYKTGDNLYAYGYTVENPFGESLAIKLEGKVTNLPGHHQVKVKDGHIQGGMSGSPVLNLRSGHVVGMIVESRDLNSPMGGYFVSIQTILAECSNAEHNNGVDILLKVNRRWHLENTSWAILNAANQTGIGILDDTWKPGHFDIFPKDNLPVDEVFIEPRCSVIRYGTSFTETDIETSVIDVFNNIIDKHPILFITGAYGAGKTLVSKIYQLSFLEQGYDTVFIAANDLLSEKRASGAAIHRLIQERASLSDKLYVFLDAFDELNSIYDYDRGKEVELLRDLMKACQRAKAVLIVNYRTLEFETGYEQYDGLILQILDTYNVSEVEFVQLKYFDSHKVREWITNYGALMDTEAGKKLTIQDIYQAHKHLIVACHNPLLLYIINYDFYEKSMTFVTIKNIYDLYSRFVDYTIKGKFWQESLAGLPVIQKITAKGYREMLQDIALEISKKSRKFTVVEALNPEDFLLDKNYDLYSLPASDVFNYISGKLQLLLSKDNFDPDKLDEKLLNCYFFSRYGNNWRFKDNNILFFFLAEKVYGHIERAIDLHVNLVNLAEVFKHLKLVVEIPLHPVVIELLLNKIVDMEDDKKSAFVFILRSSIIEEYFLSIPPDINLVNIDSNKINLDIFLCILFVQLNKEGYYEISFFFKRFTWLLSVAKRINPNMVFLAKRFYKAAQISHAEFRRVNLKGYNFDETRLKDVKFIQNKIYKVWKNNSSLTRVKYILCELDEVKMTAWSGDIEFDNCIIKSLVLKNTESDSKIIFHNCSIVHLEVTDEYSMPIELSFVNCHIQKAVLTGLNLDNLTLRHNVVKHFVVKNSTGSGVLDQNVEIDQGVELDLNSQIDFN